MRHFLFIVVFLSCLAGLACAQRTTLAEEPALNPASPRAEREEKKKNDAERIAKREPLKLPLKGPRIVVMKSKRKLELYSDGFVVRTYRVGLGFNPVDDKKREGDGPTPEGDFYVFTKNDRSAYYLSLGISYPNVADAERGLRERLISRKEHDAIVKAIKDKTKPLQYTALGGLIYIHGNGAKSDWTWGCVALENDDIRELYDAVSIGTPVTIKP